MNEPESHETQRLIAYAKLDLEIHRLRESAQELPPALKTDQNTLSAKTELLTSLRNDLLLWTTSRTTTETAKTSANAKLVELKDKINHIQNMKEYQSLLREADDIGKRIKQYDATLEHLTEQLNSGAQDLATLETEHTELARLVAEAETTWQADRAGLDQEIAALTLDLNAAGKGLSDLLRRRYTQIAQLRKPVLAEVIDGACSECNMHLPPQQYIELRRSKTLQTCPNCQRLVYIS